MYVMAFAYQIEQTWDTICDLLILASKSNARVAELVDALDLGSSAVRRESSSLSFRTISFKLTILLNVS